MNWVWSWGTWQPNSLATTVCSLGSLWTCGFALMTGQSGTTATQSSVTTEDVSVFYFQIFLVPFHFQLRKAALCKCCIFSPGCSASPCANTGVTLPLCTEMRISPQILYNLSHFTEFLNHKLCYSTSLLPVFKASLPQNFRWNRSNDIERHFPTTSVTDEFHCLSRQPLSQMWSNAGSTGISQASVSRRWETSNLFREGSGSQNIINDKICDL